jgi:hypothetical protein
VHFVDLLNIFMFWKGTLIRWSFGIVLHNVFRSLQNNSHHFEIHIVTPHKPHTTVGLSIDTHTRKILNLEAIDLESIGRMKFIVA